MLTEAALRAATDTLVGLKENVLLGHLIPAGTGFRPYQAIKPLVVGDALEDDIEDEQEIMAAAAAAAEALGARPGDPVAEIKVGEGEHARN